VTDARHIAADLDDDLERRAGGRGEEDDAELNELFSPSR
jgi:hypothetical protein